MMRAPARASAGGESLSAESVEGGQGEWCVTVRLLRENLERGCIRGGEGTVHVERGPGFTNIFNMRWVVCFQRERERARARERDSAR